MYAQHPDDETYRTGTWADSFATYEDACIYYGIDTPAQLEAEARYYEECAIRESLDDMEARGGPNPWAFHQCDIQRDLVGDSWKWDDEIPF